MSEIPEDLKRRVFATLRRFKQEQYRPLSAPEGMTPSEASVLVVVYTMKRNGVDPVQPRFVAQGLHQTPSALSQTLKTLEGKGLISRSRLAGDSRAVALDLTEKGTALATQADELREQHLGELLSYIGREDIDHMIHTLEKVLDFYKEMAEAGKMRRVEDGCAMAAHAMPDPFLSPLEGKGAGEPCAVEGFAPGASSAASEYAATNLDQSKPQAKSFEHSVQTISATEEGTACE